MAIAIFLITYALIISERVHKTTAALAGAVAVILLHVLTTEEAFEAIDLNVIFLLAGMMIVANTMATTGVFQWLAIRSAKATGGSPIGVLLILCTVTALISALLDNVTTVVLIAPVTMVVADTLGVRVAPMLIAEAIASNIGGTITLIGDPPNILIGSYAGIGFTEFTANVGPGAALALLAYLGYLRWQMRREFRATPETQARVKEIDDSVLITDPRLLRICLGVLAVAMVGFLLHDRLDYEPSAVALAAAAALLLITRQDPHHAMREVEWSTLFFFIGLFIVIGAMEHSGALAEIGRRAADVSGGSRSTATFVILWVSTFASGIIDNIPYTAVMLPVVSEMGQEIAPGRSNVFWWALAMGADLGGNLTVIGASANVLVSNLAARSGQPISFWQFARYGAPATLLTVVICTGYLWLRYLAF